MNFVDDDVSNLLPVLNNLTKEMTDDFVEGMNMRSAINTKVFRRMMHLWGLPDGVNPKDDRVIEILDKIRTEFENE